MEGKGGGGTKQLPVIILVQGEGLMEPKDFFVEDMTGRMTVAWFIKSEGNVNLCGLSAECFYWNLIICQRNCRKKKSSLMN